MHLLKKNEACTQWIESSLLALIPSRSAANWKALSTFKESFSNFSHYPGWQSSSAVLSQISRTILNSKACKSLSTQVDKQDELLQVGYLVVHACNSSTYETKGRRIVNSGLARLQNTPYFQPEEKGRGKEEKNRRRGKMKEKSKHNRGIPIKQQRNALKNYWIQLWKAGRQVERCLQNLLNARALQHKVLFLSLAHQKLAGRFMGKQSAHQPCVLFCPLEETVA